MESFPRPQAEKVKEAAILIEGHIFTGQMHGIAFNKARATMPNFEQVKDSIEQGFVTTTGRFVSREEAGVLADNSGQLEHLEDDGTHYQAKQRLDSHNLVELKKLTEDFDA
jgi:hypothetical protein